MKTEGDDVHRIIGEEFAKLQSDMIRRVNAFASVLAREIIEGNAKPQMALANDYADGVGVFDIFYEHVDKYDVRDAIHAKIDISDMAEVLVEVVQLDGKIEDQKERDRLKKWVDFLKDQVKILEDGLNA